MAQRRATVTWEGSLTAGHGTIQSGSGALSNASVSWASRMEEPNGKTSPEELLAAAEAECYAMGLTNMLTKQGTTPQQLRVTAICTVERQEAGLKITRMDLEVEGQVQGVDEQAFTRLAQEAEQNCPVSNALRGNVAISLKAHLKQTSGAGT